MAPRVCVSCYACILLHEQYLCLHQHVATGRKQIPKRTCRVSTLQPSPTGFWQNSSCNVRDYMTAFMLYCSHACMRSQFDSCVACTTPSRSVEKFVRPWMPVHISLRPGMMPATISATIWPHLRTSYRSFAAETKITYH